MIVIQQLEFQKKKKKKQENAGKSAPQKKAEMQVRMKMANKLISNFAASLRICICEAICKINPNQKKGRKKIPQSCTVMR